MLRHGAATCRRRPARPGWRFVANALLVALAALIGARSSPAQSSGIPAELQATLIGKLTSYDRNFPRRAGDVAKVVVLVRPGSAKSELSAATIRAAFGQLDRIGGLPHQEQVIRYESASALATLCRSKRVAVVYVTPGLEDELSAIKSALAGVDVLTVAALPEFVPRGIVLGFEAGSGKTKILVNLTQARQQHVDFKADVLRLMKIHR
jgi:hypothetical protein